MPIKVNMHDNTSQVRADGNSGTISDKRLEILLNNEIENRIAGDEHLQEEIDEIIEGGAWYLLIDEKEDGSIDISLLNRDERVLCTKTIHLTEKIIKKGILDYANSKIIYTCNDDSTIELDISDIVDAIHQLESDLASEVARAQQAESDLHDEIVEETTRATSEETRIEQKLDDEIDRATQAEQDLHQEILDETSRAQTAEETLDTKIDQEIQDRIDDVDAEESRAIAAENTLQSNIDSEAQTREAADNALDTKIDNETTRATIAEQAITTRIDNLDLATIGQDGSYIKTVGQQNGQLSATRQAFDVDMTNATNDNAPTTKNAKDYTDTQVTIENNRAIGEETILGQRIDAEYERASQAEATLQANIESEETRALGVENSLSQAIANESTTRASADTTLQSNIDSEASARASADEALDDKIDEEISDRTNADTALNTRINNLDLDTVGSDGGYIKTISQEDGQVSASRQSFDTTIDSNSDNTNAPTSKAVKDYVDTYGGKIDSISINGTNQPIVNKNVDLPAYPTRESLNINNVDNTSDLDKPISTATQAALNTKQDNITSSNMLSSDLVDDTDKTHKFATSAQLSQIATNTNDISSLNTSLTNHKNDTSNPHSVTKAQVGLGNVDNTSDMDKPVSTAQQTAISSVDDKLNANVHIESGDEITYNGDTVTKTSPYKNLKTGATGSRSEVIHLANTTTAGMMSPADYNQIRDNTARIEALEGTKVRIEYTTSSNPTAAQIKAFVDSYLATRGITNPTDEDYNSVSVVIKDTKHIWNYYANSQAYQDDGLDTVTQFTNSVAGIILGSSNDGQVYAENDGTGSVYGWSALKTRVNNLETTDVSLQQSITNLENNKVDKVAGKGLSTNDFTDSYKSNVDSNTRILEDVSHSSSTNSYSVYGVVNFWHDGSHPYPLQPGGYITIDGGGDGLGDFGLAIQQDRLIGAWDGLNTTMLLPIEYDGDEDVTVTLATQEWVEDQNYVTYTATDDLNMNSNSITNVNSIELGDNSISVNAGGGLTINSDDSIIVNHGITSNDDVVIGSAPDLGGYKLHISTSMGDDYPYFEILQNNTSLGFLNIPEVGAGNQHTLATQEWVGNRGYLTNITSSMITSALGYTPGTSNFSGDYNDLSNKPYIPTDTNQKIKQGSVTFGADDVVGFVGGGHVTIIGDSSAKTMTLGVESGYSIPSNSDQTTWSNKYTKPSGGIPDSDIASASTWNAKQDALQTQTAYTTKGSATKVPQITTNTLGQVTGITEVTITQPSVYDGTLTIQKNGTTVATFTANQSTNATANISVPTNLDEIADGSSRKLSNYVAKSGDTMSGALTVSSTGSNRANINLVSAADVPNDFYLGSGGSQHWSITSRGTDEGNRIFLYSTNPGVGVTVETSYSTGVTNFGYRPTVNGTNVALSGEAQPANGGNADTTDGLHVHSGRNNEANKIVRTDGNGYLLTGYINSDSGDENNSSAPARIWGTNGSDSYLRTYNKDYVQVGYAGHSSTTDYVDCFGSGPDNAYVGGKLSSFYSWNQGGTTSGYSIGITVGGHPSDPNYGWQLIQNLWNDDLYYRRYDYNDGGWKSWYKVLNPANGLSREPWWGESETHSANDLGSGITFAYTSHGTPTTGTLVSFAGIGGSCESYRLQLQGAYGSDQLFFRNRNGDSGTWNSWREIIHSGNIGSQSVNYATSAGSATNARYVIGDDNAANPGGALLQSGSGRGDASPAGDTWIYYDSLGGTSSPWGIRHDQGPNTLSFIGAGNVTATINFQNGNIHSNGAIDASNLFIVNDSSDSGYDAMVYFRNRSNNDWAQIIDCEGAEYGLDIRCNNWATYALRTNGGVSIVNGNLNMNGCSIVNGDGSGNYYYRTSSDLKAGFYYQTNGDESVVFANKYEGAGWMFVNGIDIDDRPSWQGLTPTLQIKRGGVAINKLIGQAASPSYNLDVNGSANATTVTVNTKVTMQYNSNEDCLDFVFA